MQVEAIGSGLDATASLTHLDKKDALLENEKLMGQSQNDFSAWFSREIGAVNDQIQTSESLVQQLAVGETENIHQVMIALEKAKLQFELVVQVRNRLLEGYQEIMRMQV
jgi:flagellar hook-basal body complex protein FliE